MLSKCVTIMTIVLSIIHYTCSLFNCILAFATLYYHHIFTCNSDDDLNQCEQNLGFPNELLELLLLKTAYVWTLNLWKTTPNPDGDVFMNLAAVFSLWQQLMTTRPWFECSVRRRRSRKRILLKWQQLTWLLLRLPKITITGHTQNLTNFLVNQLCYGWPD